MSLKRSVFVIIVIGACVVLAIFLRSQPSKPATENIDFAAALESVKFDPNGDHNGANGENGIPEGAEMALLTAVLQDSDLDLRDTGGIDHDSLHRAYDQAWASAQGDTRVLSVMWPATPDVVVAYTLLGKASHAAIKSMTAGFGAPLNGDYSLALALDHLLSADGDADGDGFSNRQEYYALRDQGQEAYVKAALNPEVRPFDEDLAGMPALEKTRFTVGVVLYPGFEVLDVYGPVEMWGYVPGFEMVFIAQEVGPVRSSQGAETIATHSFASAPTLDILMVPGGFGTQAELENEALLNYLIKADAHTQFTTSVCTGSALLAKAGLLDGHRATSNKRFFALAEAQSDAVEWVPEARWVESGKMITSSGVSAGIDMALGLVARMKGKMAAVELASAVEYVWNDDANDDPFAPYVDRLVRPADNVDQLVKSWPEEGSYLAESPEWLRLYFSKRPRLDSSQLRLYAVSHPDRLISLSGLHEMGANDLMFAVDESLQNGDYVLDWEVVLAGSEQAISGQVRFSVSATHP